MSNLAAHIEAATYRLKQEKPNDRSERDRWFKIIITKLEEAETLARVRLDLADDENRKV